MRHIFILIILLYLTSCGNKEKSSSPSNDTIKVGAETLQTASDINHNASPTTNLEIGPSYNPAMDSMTFISYAGYFPETGEVPIILSYASEEFKPAVDSMVHFEDGDIKRQRVAKKELSYLHLARLAALHFTTKNTIK